MPVHFLCEHCRKRLKVGRRKIGCEINCPTCGKKMIVPDEETAAAGLSMLAAARAAEKQAGQALPEFAVFDDPFAELGPAPQPVPSPAVPAAPPPAQPAPQAHALQPALSSRRASLAAMERARQPAGSRRPGWQVHILWLPLAAALAFAAGYLVGGARAPSTAPVADDEAAAESVLLRGTLSYVSADGRAIKDGGAVVLALPARKFPSRRWLAEGFRPRDREPLEGSAPRRELEQLGALYARADDEGTYSLVVPSPGNYLLLFISRGAERQADSAADAADLARLERYFIDPAAVLGKCKYRLADEHFAGGMVERSYSFGPDEG